MNDIERFMRLCGPRDKAIMENLSSARFADLLRLFNIAYLLDHDEVTFELYGVLCDRFPLRLKAHLEQDGDNEEDLALLAEWTRDFYAQAPDPQARKKLKRFAEET